MAGIDHLWAGWRSNYIEGIHDTDKPEGCVFCRILASDAPNSDTFIIWRNDLVVAILNAYPYNSGHLMVMPTRHLATLEELTTEESSALWQAVTKASQALRVAYAPEGINVGMNIGEAAGAGVPGHLHVHALPRWHGDSSFVTAIANTKVLPEPLDRTWKKLSDAWPD